MSNTIKLGQISFINCLPINYSLSKHLEAKTLFLGDSTPSFEIFEGVPAELNRKLYAGELDLAPISCFEYLSHKSHYELLANISVSSLVEADSVFFFSKFPIEELKEINITAKSATAVSLLKVLLVKKYGLKLEKLKFNVFKINENFDNKLLIGDEAMLDAGIYPVKLDLGKEWHELTGLPMVFGLWAFNKDFELAASFAKFFMQIKEDAFNRYLPDAIIEAYKKTGLPKARLVSYFEHLNYDLTDKHLESILKFEGFLKELGLIEKTQELV